MVRFTYTTILQLISKYKNIFALSINQQKTLKNKNLGSRKEAYRVGNLKNNIL